MPSNPDICLLSQTEARQLEFWGIWPSCRRHRHLKRRAAQLLIEGTTHRYVGGKDTKTQGPVSMIVECENNNREWRNVPSGGPLGLVVRQLV